MQANAKTNAINFFISSHTFIKFKLVALARERPRLPLMRELSAKLTEGEILNSQIYVFAYSAKIAVKIQITDSDYLYFHTLQILCAKMILFCLFRSIVPTTIKLNNQTYLCTIEIHDVISYSFLSLKAYGVISQKFIPQFSFPRCHILP